MKRLFIFGWTIPLKPLFCTLKYTQHWKDKDVTHVKQIWISFWCCICRKFLTPSDKENIFTLDHFPVWYRRAAENPAGSFLYYVPTESSAQGSLHPAVHIKRLRLYILLSVLCSVGFFFFPSSGWQDCDCCHVCYSLCEQKDSSCWRYDLPWLFSSFNLFFPIILVCADERPPIELISSLSILSMWVSTCAHVWMCNHVWSSPPHEHLFS